MALLEPQSRRTSALAGRFARLRGGAARLSRNLLVEDLERFRHQRFPYLIAIVLCLAVGALTLLVLPTDLAYDPWSWLIWGRQLDHLTLTTRGSGSAFKPLPVFIDAILAPARRSAPFLWMAVVRGATALAMALAFDIGRRLRGVVAGLAAALALLSIGQFSSYLALQGMCEPLQMCCCLAALECGLAGRHRAATAWLFAASMMEFELAGVLALYSLIFLVWPARRPLRVIGILVLLAVLLALAWVLPDLITGALRSQARAVAVPRAGGPLLTRVPGLATIEEVHTILFWPLIIGWAAELAAGAVRLVRRRSLRPLFLPALIALLFVLGVAILTQLHRTTGTSRFLVAAVAVGVLAAACVWAECADAVAGRLQDLIARRIGGGGSAVGSTRARGAIASRAGLVAEVIVLLALLFLVRVGVVHWRDVLSAAIQDARRGAAAQTRLPGAITAAGGAQALLSCGPIYTGAYEIPDLAWALDVPSRRISIGTTVGSSAGAVVSLQWAPVAIAQPDRFQRLATGRASDSAWQIFSTCARRG